MRKSDLPAHTRTPLVNCLLSRPCRDVTGSALSHPSTAHPASLPTQQVMQMVPTAPPKLLQLIVQGMPHKLRDRSTQCLYMTAVLALAERRRVRDALSDDAE